MTSVDLNSIFPFASFELAELQKFYFELVIKHLRIQEPWSDKDTLEVDEALRQEITNILKRSKEPIVVKAKLEECLMKKRTELVDRLSDYKQ